MDLGHLTGPEWIALYDAAVHHGRGGNETFIPNPVGRCNHIRRVPRLNLSLHLIDRVMGAGHLNLIKPGIEDLRLPCNIG